MALVRISELLEQSEGVLPKIPPKWKPSGRNFIPCFDYPIINNTKPEQYQIGIDTFARMEANCSKEEILAFCKGNIDKYNWRTKGCDLEDFKKIIDYANFAIKQLEK